MNIRLINNTGKRHGRFVGYEYGTDLFGFIYLDKIKGRERGRITDQWILNDFGSLIKVLDLEIYKREVENYENAYSR
ncbi:MAG: hypothetical protein K8R21_14215 [Leptospira sp.]|nr:hypothetical protein [Leptospira sp.]